MTLCNTPEKWLTNRIAFSFIQAADSACEHGGVSVEPMRVPATVSQASGRKRPHPGPQTCEFIMSLCDLHHHETYWVRGIPPAVSGPVHPSEAVSQRVSTLHSWSRPYRSARASGDAPGPTGGQDRRMGALAWICE